MVSSRSPQDGVEIRSRNRGAVAPQGGAHPSAPSRAKKRLKFVSNAIDSLVPYYPLTEFQSIHWPQSRFSKPPELPSVAAKASHYEPPPGLVSPPSDAQVWSYLGSQSRWVQLSMTTAFVLAGLSLAKFSLTAPWLYPLLVVLGLNVVGSVLSMLSGLNTRRVSRRSHAELLSDWDTNGPAVGPSVDVYLPTCGEDLSVLRNTYEFVSRMEWDGQLDVWVLDDAAKDDVKELARLYGFHYVVRPDRGHLKKAGNLRNAFRLTSGDFILILDADFCPRPDFLRHTIPYLWKDASIGIVQTPQVFDATSSMNWLERTAGATQELFYRWVQPSRDRAGAPICVGTCAVYRRAALDEAGGFAEIEHSEDVHTGIKLLRVGYATRYVPVLVSRGLCPTDMAGFLNQQYRWCNGSITLLKSGQANRRPLSIRQRMCFWAGFMYYITTALNVFVIHLPAVLMVLFFASEVRAEHYLPFLVGVAVYFVVMPRVSRVKWRFEVLRVQMAYGFAHAVALTHKITGRSAGWVPTGAVGKKNSLARTIAKTGLGALSVLVVVPVAGLGFAVAQHGWTELWITAVFLAGYSYLAVPLMWSFYRVLRPRALRVGPRARHRNPLESFALPAIASATR
jgi:cellulose synthase (UDP-forming)